jgi:hypothetical protein
MLAKQHQRSDGQQSQDLRQGAQGEQTRASHNRLHDFWTKKARINPTGYDDPTYKDDAEYPVTTD